MVMLNWCWSSNFTADNFSVSRSPRYAGISGASLIPCSTMSHPISSLSASRRIGVILSVSQIIGRAPKNPSSVREIIAIHWTMRKYGPPPAKSNYFSSHINLKLMYPLKAQFFLTWLLKELGFLKRVQLLGNQRFLQTSGLRKRQWDHQFYWKLEFIYFWIILITFLLTNNRAQESERLRKMLTALQWPHTTMKALNNSSNLSWLETFSIWLLFKL